MKKVVEIKTQDEVTKKTQDLPEWQEYIEGVKVHDAITINGVTKSYWSSLDPQAKMFKLEIIADYKAQHIKIRGDLKKPLNIPMANVPFFTPFA